MKAKILLVEDDESIGFIIKDLLDMQEYETVLCKDGEEAYDCYKSSVFDLCIFDVMLPKRDGFTLAQLIRERNQEVPILFLTAKTLKDDRLEGFKSGGDDYITKPFSMEELLCRVEVFLRRSKKGFDLQKIFAIGKYKLAHSNLCLIYNEEKIRLTQKEADIIRLFFISPNTVIKRETILVNVWGDDDYFMGRSLDVFMVKIRKYLSKDPDLELQNVHGIGFRLMVKI